MIFLIALSMSMGSFRLVAFVADEEVLLFAWFLVFLALVRKSTKRSSSEYFSEAPGLLRGELAQRVASMITAVHARALQFANNRSRSVFDRRGDRGSLKLLTRLTSTRLQRSSIDQWASSLKAMVTQYRPTEASRSLVFWALFEVPSWTFVQPEEPPLVIWDLGTSPASPGGAVRRPSRGTERTPLEEFADNVIFSRCIELGSLYWSPERHSFWEPGMCEGRERIWKLYESGGMSATESESFEANIPIMLRSVQRARWSQQEAARLEAEKALRLEALRDPYFANPVDEG